MLSRFASASSVALSPVLPLEDVPMKSSATIFSIAEESWLKREASQRDSSSLIREATASSVAVDASTDGEEAGVEDGFTVGVGEGSAVGLGLAVAVGVGLGLAVAVGVGVGLGFGEGVGFGVGVGEGLAVAVAVGTGLGVEVAVARAGAVGVAFGATVGFDFAPEVASGLTVG